MRWILVLSSAAALLSCKPAAATPKVVKSGTERMADTLAALYRQAVASPQGNPFLSRERADAIQTTIALQTGSSDLTNRFLMAQERLMAGQTREAIAEVKKLMLDAGLSPEGATEATRAPYDLLALAYLRLGEQENCIDNPAAEVCILPLAGGGRHTHQEGARGAIERYTSLLQSFPDDRGAQWLLNIAYLAIGGYPDSIPKQFLIPNLKPRANDPFPRFPNIAGDVGAQVLGLAGGLSIEDFNGDGLLDIFTTSWGLNQPPHLFLADGRGRYTDATAKSGLAGITGGLNTVDADYDNDGDVDIFVLRGAWLGEAGKFPNSLLRNRGDGTFEDVTFAAGLGSAHPTQTAAWGDYNLDGKLDLFVGNESYAEANGPSHPSELFMNNGDGTFTEVAAKVGITLSAFVKGVAWGDVNNDGLPDLFASVLFGPNRLFMNMGGTSPSNWRFEEHAQVAGVQRPVMSFPTWFWDFDNDGWQDLLVLSYDVTSATPLHEAVAREYLGLPMRASDPSGKRTSVESSRLYRNKGDGTFEDVTAKMGLEKKVIYAMGSNFGDLDNDGWLDFYLGTGNPDLRSIIPNRMFRSVNGKRFEEVTLPGGFGHVQKGHSTAFADLDRDGDEDVYMVLGGAYQGDRFASALFENPGGTKNSWIALELQGTTANRSAIGARVELVVDNADGSTRSLWRTIGTGGSFGSGSLLLHVGLGHATRVREVRIQWPDASHTKTTHANLDVGRTYHIVQGAEPVALDRPALPFRKVPLTAPPSTHQHE